MYGRLASRPPFVPQRSAHNHKLMVDRFNESTSCLNRLPGIMALMDGIDRLGHLSGIAHHVAGNPLLSQ